MWWFTGPKNANVGDEVGPYLTAHLLGVKPEKSTALDSFISVGSILQMALPGCIVWGSGFISRDCRLQPNVELLALRGPLSMQIAKPKLEVPLGDPALLLPNFYQGPSTLEAKRYGIVLHYAHEEIPFVIEDNIRVISCVREGQKGIESFIDELLSCELIISTSLHGFIIGNAYGIPVQPATVAGAPLAGDGMKWDDYILSVDSHVDQLISLLPGQKISASLFRDVPPPPQPERVALMRNELVTALISRFSSAEKA
jgi:hypothetical protein